MFTVPRIWILGISSVLWTVPSFILLRNALVWSADLDTGTFSLGVVLASCGILLGYLLWFKRIVVANINRIRSLTEAWTGISADRLRPPIVSGSLSHDQ